MSLRKYVQYVSIYQDVYRVGSVAINTARIAVDIPAINRSRKLATRRYLFCINNKY